MADIVRPKVGYARVSSEDQSLQLQIDALKKYGVDEDMIYTDKRIYLKFGAILAVILAATPVTAGTLSIRDADTIVVDGTPVRLQGVDAPELDTRAGQAAKRWMVNFLRGKDVRCDLTGEQTYDRWVGVCYADGQEIGAAVIAAGHALDCRRYSGGRYRKLETPAAKSRIRRAGYC